MRPNPLWEAQLLDKDENPQCVYDIAIKPDGSMIIIASGTKLLVYDPDGKLIQPLKGHSGTVYCVGFSKDGLRFASGGADKQVIIWTCKLEGILRYSHHDAVQCLAYNPVSDQLASCAFSDFGLWSPEQKSVSKHRIGSRVSSCSWTSDGMILALGLVSGCISLRARNGDEKVKIERPGGSIVWCVSWSPVKDSNGDQVLAVADWNQTLSFYNVSGKQIGRERALGYDALKLSYFSNGDYILISGANKKCSLYTKEGVFVGFISQQDSWVWCCAARDDSTQVAIGTQDGIVAYYDVGFSTVHSLYRDRYAFRQNMTDVVVQHLITEDKVVVKCRELVKKVAIYKERLAIQMPERINIYEVSNDSSDMHYKIKEKINMKVECTLLVVCAEHIVLCQEKILQCLNFNGILEKEWIMDALIRYIKVIGGPVGKESLLVGLRNGQVIKIFVDNALPVPLLKIGASVRCLDLSAKRKKLAVVDENNTCSVYDLTNNSLLYQEPCSNSVAWNNHHEDMLCFTGAGFINIKVENFVVQQQKFQGFVIGFCGAKVFCLHFNSISTLDIPLSASMYQYMEKKMFSKAYRVACLGVTDGDWRALAETALQNLDFEISRQAFIRIKDFLFLKLIRKLKPLKKNDVNKQYSLLGDIYAYLGKFNLAANFYRKAKEEEKAVVMFTDLRMFDRAQEFISSADTEEKKAIVLKQADWAKSLNESKAAAELYLSIGETEKAVELAAENNWGDMLKSIAKKVDLTERKTLLIIGTQLKRLQEYGAAAEIFHKVGDIPSLIDMNVESKNWKEAFELAKQHPEYKVNVFVPYANWLAENDRFVDAQKAFYAAGCEDQAVSVLEMLTDIAVNQKRFKEAGYYYWILSMQSLKSAADIQDDYVAQQRLKKFWCEQFAAEVYYAYSHIYNYLEEPFTMQNTETLFNIARYLWLQLVKIDLPGISKFRIYYAAAKQSSAMKAYKLARTAYQQASMYRIPERFSDLIDLATMHVHAKPFSDSEEVLPMCYKCSTSNPLINKQGNICCNCQHPFAYSFISFEILPVVEFFLEDGITDEEAYKLLSKTPRAHMEQNMKVGGPDIQCMKLDEDPFTFSEREDDIFSYDTAANEQRTLSLNRQDLIHTNFSEVVICKWPPPLRTQYYKNVLPSVQITRCPSCNKLFHSDDYELELLKKNCCPFCRITVEELEASDD
ncbi:LOW QUALITY PROTEIN: intraflagellar transport protein 122 homolog [Uloborus diversus]|uniref:LOW QUALITY PROTEIN: intraflagellar transport protein 122 homolog n=1 Tax=Uloborus diversus TaxID=327109 RepID=UPI00240A501E|nr:LOW QUALITY PROTEIN: intraflagellar transport protein 122 homolog [Uloborus diversus]